MVAAWVLMKVKILLLHPGLLGMVEKMPVENCISPSMIYRCTADFFNGVRRLGSAAVDMSHVGLGITKLIGNTKLSNGIWLLKLEVSCSECRCLAEATLHLDFNIAI